MVDYLCFFLQIMRSCYWQPTTTQESFTDKCSTKEDSLMKRQALPDSIKYHIVQIRPNFIGGGFTYPTFQIFLKLHVCSYKFCFCMHIP